jgi:ubiquinone/menaquinone biosynthesis C-methylase UbiE
MSSLMRKTTTLTNYDVNAADFDYFRQPNSRIAERLSNSFALKDGTILSLGCGTGMYEAIFSETRTIVGIDRSGGMINRAKERIENLVQGDMLFLPFTDRSFSGAYFMQSLHHVGANLEISPLERDAARKQALKEVIRVIDYGATIFIVQRDPSQNQAVWFWKYFPRALEAKLVIQPKIKIIMAWLENLGLQNVTSEPINDPMNRRFYDPSAPLDPGFRRSHSDFSYLSEQDVQDGIERLQTAIANGSVLDDIETCKLRFAEIGGTVFVVSGEKV